MLVFDEKTLNPTRRKALGLNKVYVDSSISTCDEVKIDMDFANHELKFLKNNVTVAEDEEPEIYLMVKELGFFGQDKGVVAEGELILFDNYICFNLIRGAVVVNLDGKQTVVSRGVDPAKLPAVHIEDAKWVSYEDINQISAMSIRRGIPKDFPFDYVYTVVMSGCSDGSKFTFIPALDPVDISGGEIARKMQEAQYKQRALELEAERQKLLAMVRQPKNIADDDDEDEYYEDEEDDEEYYDDEY